MFFTAFPNVVSRLNKVYNFQKNKEEFADLCKKSIATAESSFATSGSYLFVTKSNLRIVALFDSNNNGSLPFARQIPALLFVLLVDL